ncbi:hypothetical protein L579_2135 [Pantoea sp. AS-PWVM4]|nr:hypothetical protein L579_2135 [Pantoea sp. AS-PWVM4]
MRHNLPGGSMQQRSAQFDAQLRQKAGGAPVSFRHQSIANQAP